MSERPGDAIDAIVTDHAVLRFLERAHGLDVERVRAAIADATARGREAAAAIEADDFVVTVDKIKFAVRDGRVVTALPAHWRRRLRRRR